MRREHPIRMRGLSAAAALGLAVPVLGACSTAPAPVTAPADAIAEVEEGAQGRSADVADDDASARQSDQQITAALSARLGKDPDPDLHAIGVSTAAGVVTLSGTVTSPGARNVAMFIAGDVAGVVSIDDDILVEADAEGSP